jgi:hypothetical protein
MIQYIKNVISKSDLSYSVGQRIYSRNTGRVLCIKRELYVNNIKHFSASIESPHRQRSILLSEVALREFRYEIISNNI